MQKNYKLKLIQRKLK